MKPFLRTIAPSGKAPAMSARGIIGALARKAHLVVSLLFLATLCAALPASAQSQLSMYVAIARA
jgi:hypothetical protein